ncbi:MAG: type II toxin-antitoxin system RelE/ParE family toxin [Rubrivivax sp.]|nr:type II toxin-antitoxin system RelE/ParE family toxin [Rubrivivax sp.]
MQIVVDPAAQHEPDAALQWSKTTFGRGTAARLQRRFEQAGQMLMGQLAIGTPDAGQARKLRLGKFPYSLAYRLHGGVITVIAVAHQSRHPEYWVGR